MPSGFRADRGTAPPMTSADGGYLFMIAVCDMPACRLGRKVRADVSFSAIMNR